MSDDTFIMTPIPAPPAEPQRPYEQLTAPYEQPRALCERSQDPDEHTQAPAQAAHAAPAPVFVDASGRRRRGVRRLGLALAVLAAGSRALVISTARGGPTLTEPFLPL